MIYILLLGSIEDILNSQGSISELEDILFLSSDTVLLSDCKDVVDVQLNQGTFDDVCLEVYDKETTQTDIETYEFPKVWHKFVVFYADFENNNLAAGNFDYTISEITSLIIKRRLYNSVEPFLPIFEKQVYSDIGSNEFNFAFTDYLVKNHQEYEYKLVPILKNGIEGLPIYATYEDVRKLDFNGVFICEPNSVYSTFLEVEVTANKDIADTVVKPLGRKYPIVFRGTQNKGYIGTVKGLFAPYITHCEFNFENAWDYRNKLNDFLLDGKSKVLKYIILLTSSSSSKQDF